MEISNCSFLLRRREHAAARCGTDTDRYQGKRRGERKGWLTPGDEVVGVSLAKAPWLFPLLDPLSIHGEDGGDVGGASDGESGLEGFHVEDAVECIGAGLGQGDFESVG